MGQQQVKALAKSGKGIKSSLRTKDVEKSEFHTAPGTINNGHNTVFSFPKRMLLISVKPHINLLCFEAVEYM